MTKFQSPVRRASLLPFVASLLAITGCASDLTTAEQAGDEASPASAAVVTPGGESSDDSDSPADAVSDLQDDRPPTGSGPMSVAATTNNFGFELGNLNGFNCSGNCPRVATSLVASGARSGEFLLTRQMPTSYRTEVTLNDGGVFDFGHEYWLKLSFRYEDWAKDSNAEAAPFQVHTRPSDWSDNCNLGSALSTAPFLMVTQNDEQRFVTYGGKTLWHAPIPKKKWQTVTVHFRPSMGGDGFVEAWKDGLELGRVDGPNSPRTDKCGKPMLSPYFKMGVYKWDWRRKATDSSVRRMFIDDLKISAGSTPI